MDETRRIQITGSNTYIVSLPQEWVKQSNLEKGDQVYLTTNADGTITLSQKQMKRVPKDYIIEADGDRANAMRNVVSAYISGAGKITIRGKEISSIAEHARQLLSGVEIVDETENEISLKVLAFDELEVNTVIKRAFGVTKSMFTFASEICRNGKGNMLEISKKEEEVDRLYILLLRELVAGKTSPKKAVFKAVLAKSIEKIGDHVLDLCDNAKDAGKNEWLADLVDCAGEVYFNAVECWMKKEITNAKYKAAKVKYIEAYEKMDGEIGNTKDLAKRLILLILLEKCNKIVRYSDDIMECNTDMAFISS